MEKRNLGNTGMPVTVLGYGAMELRHVEGRAEAERLLNSVLDSGINYIDTSPDYQLSETYLGQALAQRRREFYLASKCGCNVDQNGKSLDPPHIWNRIQLLRNIETSLRLLKTDYLDVWQLHGVFPDQLVGGRHDEVLETMLTLKQQGKVRAIGLSFRNGTPDEALFPAGYGARDIKAFLDWDVFEVMQIVYGGLTRHNEIAIDQAAAKGVGMIIRGVVRKYRANYDDLFKQAKLNELCAANETQSDFLIRFALNHAGLSTMIIGTKNLEHLAANIVAAEKGKLPADVYAEAKRRLEAIGIAPATV
jgi:aryl-alcohol dehydrogenase-like predicted oxidoreductase